MLNPESFCNNENTYSYNNDRVTYSYYDVLSKLNIKNAYHEEYNKCTNDCIGIEMEVDIHKNTPNITLWNQFLDSYAYNNIKWCNLVLLKYDYTVPYGVEINFQPIKFNDFDKINWNNFFDLIIKEHGSTNKNTGLHLHIPKNGNDLKKITKLILSNKDDFIRFMGRHNKKYAFYCTYEDYLKDTGKHTGKHCNSKFSVVNNHYYQDTIEIRGFKTTLNQYTFKKYVDLMMNLSYYSQNKISQKEIIDSININLEYDYNYIYIIHSIVTLNIITLSMYFFAIKSIQLLDKIIEIIFTKLCSLFCLFSFLFLFIILV